MPRPPARVPTLALLAAAGLATAPPALADVPVAIPARLLGGPIWPALQPPATASPHPSAGAAGLPSRSPARPVPALGPAARLDLLPPADVGDPDDPEDGAIPGIDEPGPGDAPDDGVPLDRKLAAPEGPEADDGDDAADPAADPDAPTEPPVTSPAPPPPALPPEPAAVGAAYGGLVSPTAAGWLMWQTPTLRWRAAPGASYYNVQVFRGARRVLNAWPTARRLRVPPGVLRQGRTYVWVVWPGVGPRRAGAYGPALGRSTFAVTLRPRIVFRRRGGGGVVGEVRPHIPFGTLRLERPRAVAGRVPAQVTLTRRGRFLLPIRAAQAERIGATLRDRGPLPPVGLRG